MTTALRQVISQLEERCDYLEKLYKSRVIGENEYVHKTNEIKSTQIMLGNLLPKEKETMINFHIEVMKLGLINEGERKWTEGYLPKIKSIAEDYFEQTILK